MTTYFIVAAAKSLIRSIQIVLMTMSMESLFTIHQKHQNICGQEQMLMEYIQVYFVINVMMTHINILTEKMNTMTLHTQEKGWNLMSKNDKMYINELEGLIKYQYGYDILMEYWDSFPDEDKPKIHKRLKEVGL